jgi:hypothetical protein
MQRFADAPETNVAIFAFLLNLPWELAQVPLFAGMPTARHWTAVLACGRATLGDVAIALAGFWAVAAVVGTRRWVLAPTRGGVLGFMAAGVAITIGMERLATSLAAAAVGRPAAARRVVRASPAHVSGVRRPGSVPSGMRVGGS